MKILISLLLSFIGLFSHHAVPKPPPQSLPDPVITQPLGGVLSAQITVTPLPYDSTIHSASCTISAVKTLNLKGDTVAQFSWTASNGTNGWISPDVGFIPALNSSLNAIQVPLTQPITYTLIVSTGTATSSCATTISP